VPRNRRTSFFKAVYGTSEIRFLRKGRTIHMTDYEIN